MQIFKIEEGPEICKMQLQIYGTFGLYKML